MKNIKCNYCGRYFETEEKEFGYCPHCENDQVEIGLQRIEMRNRLLKQQEIIAKHIVTMYDGTTPANCEELKKFAKYIISQYDLYDLYDVIRQECEELEEESELNIADLEYEEYKFNVLDRREVC